MINNIPLYKMYNKHQSNQNQNNNYYIIQDKSNIIKSKDKIHNHTENKYPSNYIFHSCLHKLHKSYFFLINMFLKSSLYRLLKFLSILCKMFDYMVNIRFQISNRMIHMLSKLVLNHMLSKEIHIPHTFSLEFHLI
jgi:hypothetical protein